MTNVLLTGAGGFLGSHVLEVLINRGGYYIFCIDSFRHNGITDNITDVLAYEDREDVSVITHDLCAPMSTSMLNAIESCEYVINTASFCQVEDSTRRPAEFIRNNVDTILTTLEAARVLNMHKVVHVSTDEVYGPIEYGSNYEHCPSSPYAASKAAQEDICHAYARTYELPINVVSSANMFGERQSLLAFIPKVIHSLMNDKKIYVHYYGAFVLGERWYTYVRNVAEYIVDALHQGIPHEFSKSVLRGQRKLNNREVVLLISELLNIEPNYGLTEARPGYDISYPELRSFNQYNEWSPKITFDDGLERTLRYALDNRD